MPVATAFSHHVVGPHADELLTDFRNGESSLTESVFESVTVTANWADQAVSFMEHTLVPRGVVSVAHNGSVTGGVFERYNGRPLSDGEHYLIEQRKRNGLVVRQPMGGDTPLEIRAFDDWKERSRVLVKAFNRYDESIELHDVVVQADHVGFSYLSEIPGSEVTVILGRQNIGSGIEVVTPWEQSVVVDRDGREARGFESEDNWKPLAFRLTREIIPPSGGNVRVRVEYFDEVPIVDGQGDSLHIGYVRRDEPEASDYYWDGKDLGNRTWKVHDFLLTDAIFGGKQWGEQEADITMWLAPGYYIGKVTVTNADELERRTVAYYTIHDPTQGETLTQGLHLRGWTDATQPIADLDLDGLQAIYAWDAEAASWLLYSPDIPARFNNIDKLEQGRAYYVRVRNGQTLHWPDAPYGGVGYHLQPGRNLVCWLGTPDKSLTDAIAPLRGMKAEPLVSVTLDGRTYDVEESRSATEPLPYGQALWVEIDAVGPTRWLQF